MGLIIISVILFCLGIWMFNYTCNGKRFIYCFLSFCLVVISALMFLLPIALCRIDERHNLEEYLEASLLITHEVSEFETAVLITEKVKMVNKNLKTVKFFNDLPDWLVVKSKTFGKLPYLKYEWTGTCEITIETYE